MRKKFAIFLLLVVALGSSTLIPTVRKRIFDFGSNGGFQAIPNAIPAYTATLAAVENSAEASDLDPYYVKGGGAINTASVNNVSFNDRVASGGVHAPEPAQGLFSEEAVYRYPKFPVNDLAGFNYNDGSSNLPVEQMVFLPKSDETPGSVPSSGPGGPFGGGGSSSGSGSGGSGSGGGSGGGGGGLPNFGGGSVGDKDDHNEPASDGDANNPTYPNQDSPKDDGVPHGDNPPGGGHGDQPPAGPNDTNYGLPPDQSFYTDDTPPGGGGGIVTEPGNTDTGLPQDNVGDGGSNRVPDSGSTLALLGTAFVTLAWVRRKMS